jgi:hypothetical protein
LQPRTRHRLGPGRARPRLGLALGTLVLAGAAGAVAQSRPAQAQESAQQLIERLRQIQGEGSGAGASEQELLERIRRVQTEFGTAPPAKLSPEQVRERIAEALGVEVLSVDRVAAPERPAYALKVMNPPGNYNAAFRVVTLLVDGDTGEVLGEVQASPDVDDPDAFPARRDAGGESGLELRRRTWR